MPYKLLGRSGLHVSELCLSTMTFGKEWSFGSSKEESKEVFDAFVDAGGSFIDTANFIPAARASGSSASSWVREGRNSSWPPNTPSPVARTIPTAEAITARVCTRRWMRVWSDWVPTMWTSY